ncbi:efflux RND transporter periplasmic adaptor subunit [Aestuariicella sp. G3-2]|uniref:efflux RND transporter periplasmic adaptor subunit n=1 Tax=Pseudomaricurvus albidus TaxID=2842452 RepID=UPI001C0C18E8|nr:efflux RND transporter periplasmic adaptor subunit [Aestuariicella albida]MBU3071575.1 efflux RND transporter periplasmic adaptor subunit [Aestuariicella albida]
MNAVRVFRLVMLAAVCLAAPGWAQTPAEDFLPSVGCMIEPSVRIEVSSPVEGVLDKRPFKLGQSVKKGQLLFSLRSDVEKASVELANIRAEFALRHYQRNDNLYQDELISVHERDEFQTDYQVALKELEQAKAILGLRSVSSPIDGVVVDYFVESGEFVMTEPVMALAALDPLKVEVVMPYSSLGSVSDKDVLQVFPVEPVSGKYSAKVTLIDPVIDAASGTYRIRALIDNPQRRLPAGVECKVAVMK